MHNDLPIGTAGLGYRRALAENFLKEEKSNSVIQFIEIAPENWIKMGGQARYLFDQVAERFPVACHGLSLSLGGQDALDFELLGNIKQLMRQYHSGFFSEHLSYCSHNGHLYDLLPLPFTEDMVHHVAKRISKVQDFLGHKIALENTSYYAHSPLAEMTEVAFLNAIVAEADCDIHLDINNIYVNQINHSILTAQQFLQQVDKARVRYLHIAGHDKVSEDLLIDSHGAAVIEPVWQLLDDAYAILGYVPPTLLERDFNLPSFSELKQEVAEIAKIQQKYHRHVAA